jgi:hypothetical protein
VNPNPTAFLNAVGGGIAIFVLYFVFMGIVGAFRDKSAKRLLTTVALGNGLILSVGLSPMGLISKELVSVTPILTANFSNFVYSMIDVGTVLDLTLGAILMYDKSDLLGVVSFYWMFITGFLLPIEPVVGALFLIMGYLTEEASSTGRW